MNATTRNPVKAIRTHCLKCSGGSPKAVAECPSANCALFSFRLGRNPFRAPISEAQKKRAIENFRPKLSGADHG
jgi:hypothetical protein